MASIRLAVTEACNNCVLHAYGDCSDTCTYVLDARVDQHVLRVTACDSGVGIHNAQRTPRPSLGRGLHLIQSLADSAQIDAAFVDYTAAARGTNSVPERNYLAMKATRLGD